jgi:hypothetical protein
VIHAPSRSLPGPEAVTRVEIPLKVRVEFPEVMAQTQRPTERFRSERRSEAFGSTRNCEEVIFESMPRPRCIP